MGTPLQPAPCRHGALLSLKARLLALQALSRGGLPVMGTPLKPAPCRHGARGSGFGKSLRLQRPGRSKSCGESRAVPPWVVDTMSPCGGNQPKWPARA